MAGKPESGAPPEVGADQTKAPAEPSPIAPMAPDETEPTVPLRAVVAPAKIEPTTAPGVGPGLGVPVRPERLTTVPDLSPPIHEPEQQSQPAAPSTTPALEPAASTSAGSTAEPGGQVTMGGPRDEPKRVEAPAAAGSADGIQVTVFGRTDVGLVREHNEDNFLIADLTAGNRSLLPDVRSHEIGPKGSLFVVCDGMGGAAAGEVASQLAVDIIYERVQAGDPASSGIAFAGRIVSAIEEAGRQIFSAAKADRTRRGMGTTVTAAGLLDQTLYLAQVGDSRAYAVRGSQIELVTRDQSLVNQLIEAGQLTQEEAEAFEHSNIILQALGTAAEVSVDVTHVPLRRGDTIVVCSDGLSGVVNSEQIREAISANREPIEACKRLTDMANAAGGPDNITVIVARFEGSGLLEPSAEERLAFARVCLPEPDERDDPSEQAHSQPPAEVPAGEDVAVSDEDRDSTAPPKGSNALIVVLLLLLLAAGAAALYMVLTGALSGAHEQKPFRAGEAAVPRARNPQALPVSTLLPTSFRTAVPDAHLVIDGVERGTFENQSLKLPLSPGVHHVAVVAGGQTIISKEVTVVAGAGDNDFTLGEMPEDGPAPLAPVAPVPVGPSEASREGGASAAPAIKRSPLGAGGTDRQAGPQF